MNEVASPVACAAETTIPLSFALHAAARKLWRAIVPHGPNLRAALCESGSRIYMLIRPVLILRV
jgi:hypothetical protein